jgi:hypothetical protein
LTRPAPATSTAAATRAAAFCRQNELQHFLRILKDVAVFLPGPAQHFGSQLRRHLDPGHRAIFGHISDFVNLDAGLAGKRGFQLLGQGTGFRVTARKCANESRKISLCSVWREVNAGDSRRCQQLREALLRRRRSQRHAVQNDLVAGSAQQQSRVSTLIQRRTQFLPSGFKLCHSAHVPKLVQTCELQQNVQAVNERAS